MTKYRVTYVTEADSIADALVGLAYPKINSLTDGADLTGLTEVWIEEVSE